MDNNANQPREYDAVLSGQAPPPVEGVVLGGLEGVKRRLTNTVVEAQVAALSEALNYGEVGLDLVIRALQDSSKQVQHCASRLLREKGGLKGKQALLEYDPWLFFTTLEDWKTEEFNPEVGITDPVGTAYVVELKKVGSGNQPVGTVYEGGFNLLGSENQPVGTVYEGGFNLLGSGNTVKVNQFKALLQDPQAKNLEALKCEIEDNYWNRLKNFQAFVNALVKARSKLPNLKALFIGNSDQNSSGKYRILMCNVRPLLKAYPNLELLKISGCIDDENFLKPNLEILQIRSGVDGSAVQVKSIIHNHLKTLVIEAPYISNTSLAQICNLDLPALEYLELWLNRRDTYDTAEATIDSLTRVLSGQSCPNLMYLGLIGSENTDAIVKAVSESVIIERIKVLDLSSGTLSNAGAITLLNCPAVNRLHTLNVSENRLSTNMIQQLSKLNCRVIAESQSDDRYYSVWE